METKNNRPTRRSLLNLDLKKRSISKSFEGFVPRFQVVLF